MAIPFAPHPGKAAAERWWLLYTPVWGLLTGVVMLSGWAEAWGDAELLVFGVVIALGALLPLVRQHPTERDRPWHRRAGVKLTLAVALYAFGLNYVQTPFFFDVLHMHYGFRVRWVIDRNPIFLYLVTVAYFATYCALCLLALRWLTRSARTAIGRGAAWVIAPFAMALLETLLNANPWMSALFCYDDPALMLGFGTLVYGMSFVFVLPAWMAIDETPEREISLAKALLYVGLALVADGVFLALVRTFVAPLLTTVIDDAPGLGHVAGSCLAR
jgi:cycloeucalenol cycloisomerase